MSINERILLKIKESGLSANEIKEKTGIDKSTLSRWKDEKYKPSIDALVALSQLLNISSDYFLFGYDKANQNTLSQNSLINDTISPDEYNLLKIYREIDDTGKREIQDNIREIWFEHRNPKNKLSHSEENLSDTTA